MKREGNPNQSADLRRKAEERLEQVAHQQEPSPSEIDALALVHELQVHQIELELQNEELRRASAEVENLLSKYSDLYDFAPVGYVTISGEGTLIELNLTAARMLGANRAELKSRPIWPYVAPESQTALRQFLQRLRTQAGKLAMELKLLSGRRMPFDALVEGVCAEEGRYEQEACRVAITNITERKDAERALQSAYEQQEVVIEHRTRELWEANKALDRERKAAEARAEREHHVAVMLQQALVPALMDYHIGNLEVSACYKPASREAEIGGDFFDVFEMDGGLVGVVIGDVVGKGVQAAARAVAARHVIRSYAYLDPSPAAVMTLANKALCRTDTEGSEGLLTACYMLIDTGARTITCANGGHEPAMLRDEDGNVSELACMGAVMGVEPNESYLEATRDLGPRDLVVAVTDGLTEARKPGSEILGKEALIRHLAAHPDACGQEVIHTMMQAAESHAGGILQDDAIVLTISLA